MPLFKKLDYGKLLYEALRSYYSVNVEGDLSILYRYCICFLYPLIVPFQVYDAARRISELVAGCKWQIGQLTNVLNYIYDADQKRIFLVQSVSHTTAAPTFPYNTTMFGRGFGEAVRSHARTFYDTLNSTKVVINVPAGVDLSAITATIEQIKPSGILYQINVF